MPLKRMVIFVVLFLFALRTYAQEDSIIVDTNFYECFTRELIIRLSGKKYYCVFVLYARSSG